MTRLTHRCRRLFSLASCAVGVGAAVAPALAQTDFPRYAPHEIIVQFANNRAKLASGWQTITDSLGLTDEQPVFRRRAIPRLSTGTSGTPYHYRLRDGVDPAIVAQTLSGHPGVAYAQPNYIYRQQATSQSPPSDPRWEEQWGAQRVGLEHVWQMVNDGGVAPVPVGIIDSGIDYLHPELKDRLWRNQAEVDGLPGVDDDANGFVDDTLGYDFTDAPDLSGAGDYLDRDSDPMDRNGHGTFVSGVIAATGDNGIGIAGVAQNALLMPLRAGADLEFGGAFLEDDDIAAAIVYATDNGARVINMSFGDVVNSPIMGDAIHYAYDRGVICVASAGNNRTGVLIYPAALKETISVSSIDINDQKSHFASYGENLDLTAPGSEILTTTINNRYSSPSGTSLSAPFVSGAVALLLGVAPIMSPKVVANLLRGSAVDLGPPGWDPETGHGRLDLPNLFSTSGHALAVIRSPVRPSGGDELISVVGTATGLSPLLWQVTYGVGSNPTTWTHVAAGTEPVRSKSLAAVDVSDLPQGIYSIRLVLDDASGSHREDRTVIEVSHAAEFTNEPETFLRWYDDEKHLWLRWQTAETTRGSLIFRQMGSSSTFDTVCVSLFRADHVVDVTSVLGSGEWELAVLAETLSGHQSVSDTKTVDASSVGVVADQMEQLGAFGFGVLMPELVDFDGDGLPEIVLKEHTRPKYDTLSVFGWDQQGVFRLGNIPTPMRPAGTADIDGDGLWEVMGIAYEDRFLTKFVEQPDGTSLPSVEFEPLENRLAPSVADVDGDGSQELILLDDLDRSHMKLLTSTADNTLSLAADLAFTEPVQSFGIWRAAGSMTGDSRYQIVSGTTDGGFGAFEFDGSTNAKFFAMRDGDGDTQRTFGGTDLDGDGLGEFIAVRHIEEDRFDPAKQYWRIEVWEPAAGGFPFHLEWSVEIGDPNSSGTGFVTGDLTGDGLDEFVLGLPPRLYVFTADGPDAYKAIWYSPTAKTCQPVIADVNADGSADLLFQHSESNRVYSPRPQTPNPLPPTGFDVRAFNATTIEAAWHDEPGLSYRLWSGPAEDELSLTSQGLTGRVARLENLRADQKIFVALQAVNASLGADSLGRMTGPLATTPNSPPFITNATAISAQQIAVDYSETLGPDAQDPDHFRLALTGHNYFPSSVILGRNRQRTLLFFAKPIATADYDLKVTDLRDSSGASLSGSYPIRVDLDTSTSSLSSVATPDLRSLHLRFSTQISQVRSVKLNRGLQIALIATEGFDITVTLATSTPMVSGETYAIAVTATGDRGEFQDGALFTAHDSADRRPLTIVGVSQISSTALTVVFSDSIHPKTLTSQFHVSPGIRLTGSTIEGATVTMSTDSTTRFGACELEYTLTAEDVRRSSGTETTTTSRSFIPLTSARTGAIDTVFADNAAQTVTVVFDTTLSAGAASLNQFHIYPNIRTTGVNSQEKTATLNIDPDTPIGPWGIVYQVQVSGVVTTEGDSLFDVACFEVDLLDDLTHVFVFPSPFVRSQADRLTIGGLPFGASVSIYTLSGERVIRFVDVRTGGVQWDGNNAAGAMVGSGVYLYAVSQNGQRILGKLAVVR